MEWVLIVWVLTPGGDFIDKYAVPYPTEKACVADLKKSNKPYDSGHPLGLKQRSYACVTMDHYSGKKLMKGVPLD